MAYQSYEFRCVNIADFWTAIQAFMTAIGWTTHDAISATRIVYKSNGEDAAKPYVYVDIEKSTNMQCRTYLYWNTSTHAGTVLATANSNNMGWLGATYNCLLAGDKDLVFIATTSITTTNGYGLLFGHWPFVFDSTKTTTTADITSGSSVSIPVVSSAGFGIGTYCTIMGANYEGRDRLSITGIPDATHILVASLPRNYATGAIIGRIVHTGGVTSTMGNWYPLVYYSDAGTTNPTNTYSFQKMMEYAAVNVHTQLRNLTPVMLYTTGFNIAYNKQNGPLYGYGSSGDIFAVMNDKSIPPVSSVTAATASTLTDSTKSWTVDALIGKFAVITNGTGVNQLRKITDNDATSLTVESDWVTTPDATSEYKVIDTAYRYTYIGTWKILETKAPS